MLESARREVRKGVNVPLSQKVTFQAALEARNKVQVPKLIRREFKMEPDQVLLVGVGIRNSLKDLEFFYARMTKDARIRIPKTARSNLQNEDTTLAGQILELTLEPASE